MSAEKVTASYSTVLFLEHVKKVAEWFCLTLWWVIVKFCQPRCGSCEFTARKHFKSVSEAVTYVEKLFKWFEAKAEGGVATAVHYRRNELVSWVLYLSTVTLKRDETSGGYLVEALFRLNFSETPVESLNTIAEKVGLKDFKSLLR